MGGRPWRLEGWQQLEVGQLEERRQLEGQQQLEGGRLERLRRRRGRSEGDDLSWRFGRVAPHRQFFYPHGRVHAEATTLWDAASSAARDTGTDTGQPDLLLR